MKVIVSDRAESDLERIGDYIATESPRRAVTFVLELREKCLSLGSAPKAFTVVGRYRLLAIRRRVHGDYLIFYRLGRNGVNVLRVLHGATDFEATLTDSTRPR